MKPPTNPTFRTLLALVTGIGVGGVVVAIVELVNGQLFPLPPGLTLDDPEALGLAVAEAGPGMLVGVALAWLLGSFSGAWLATAISGSPRRILAGVVTVFFLLGALVNLAAFPHPTWFVVAGPLALAAGGHLGWMLGARTAHGGPNG